ncbi:MAG: nicotinate (nicotinamide) nucleotide adenylyltransferase [Acidobacteria bacterium]|nr:nicotinate (nicotinamide) nucleotide adenylyltransferase [Acidobacteriota bacterium]MBV9475407.1 nicotinate (nicotinamide) nucleotide adenylyltransferase [Acidobacteriota bacterium]
MKIGICGGTFDPFHRGHLDPILAARETLEWDRVVYIPAFVQPFKMDRAAASGYHRFAMTVLGTEQHDVLYVSPWELERGAISYTVDTLAQLRAEHSDATIDWIIGDDNLARLLEWKSIDTILTLANFAVLTRGGREGLPHVLHSRVTDARERGASGAIVFAENATVPVSSTDIRLRIRAGEPIDDLVPPPVSRYIHHNGLYRKGAS